MTRRTRIVWTAVAVLFTAVNLGGAPFAAFAGEAIHAGVHILLGIAGLYITVLLLRRRSAESGAALDASTPDELPDDRLSSLERSVDAVAIEVERIGEGQRFMTKVLTERDPARAPDKASNPEEQPPPTHPDVKRR